MSKAIDETGKKYGYLTVIERAPNSQSGRAKWVCNCDCGTKGVVVLGHQLRSGRTKSCGCYQKEQTLKACLNDITGQTFGNFFVIESAGTTGTKHLWRCKCLLCGNENAIINSVEIKHTYSCGCTLTSKGERKIKTILGENNISFITEKRFSDCVFEDTKQKARFDFFLPDYNCIIEYDGVQHFVMGNGHFDNEEKFKRTQLHDQIKNEYCKKNNISLIRIPYTHFDNINIDDLIPETSKYLVNN